MAIRSFGNISYLIDDVYTNSRLLKIDFDGEDLFSLLNALPFVEKPNVVVFGKVLKQNRDVLFLSDVIKSYPYTGTSIRAESLDLCPEIRDIMESINVYLEDEFRIDSKFNAALINRYRDGDDYIGSHSDDERQLRSKNIATICYGPGLRNFRIRKKAPRRFTNPIILNHYHKPGELLLMLNNFQSHYKHEIPKQKKIREPRISVTFRSHIE